MDNRSISQEVVMIIIREFLTTPPRGPRQATRALLELTGTWQDERSADQIVADMRGARRCGRRFAEKRHVLD